jgi:hypothetical protein
MLHEYKLKFIHPLKGEKILIEAPLPEDMTEIIKILEKCY